MDESIHPRRRWEESVSRHARHKNEFYLAERLVRGRGFPLVRTTLRTLATFAQLSISEAQLALSGLEASGHIVPAERPGPEDADTFEAATPDDGPLKPRAPRRPRPFARATDPKWRVAIITRDRKCVDCGSQENLHAHHIFPKRLHPELQRDRLNGVALCEPCHMAVTGRELEHAQRFLAIVVACYG